jgi:hypothetical protein
MGLPSFLYDGYRGLFPWGYNGKGGGGEVDHSSQSSAEVKNGGELLSLLICYNILQCHISSKFINNFDGAACKR